MIAPYYITYTGPESPFFWWPVIVQARDADGPFIELCFLCFGLGLSLMEGGE